MTIQTPENMSTVIDQPELHYIMRLMQKEDIPQVTTVDRLAFPNDEPPTSFEKRLQNRAVCYIVACKNTPEQYDTTPNSDEKPVSEDKTDRGRFPRIILPDPRQLFQNPSRKEQFIYGFAGFWLVIDEAHLLDIGVRPDYQHMGIGESLLISIISLSLRSNARLITLEVRVSNKGAQSLYRKYGFVEVGRRYGYYPDNHEDAFIMNTDRLNTPGYRVLFEKLKQSYIKRWGENRKFIL